MHDNSDPPKTGGTCRQGQDTISMADVLELPRPLRELVTWMMRRDTCSLDEIASRLEDSEEMTRATLKDLIARGFVTQVSATRYLARPTTTSRRKAPRGIWNALEGLGDE